MYMKLDRNRRFWAVGAGVAVVILLGAYVLGVDDRDTGSMTEPPTLQEPNN